LIENNLVFGGAGDIERVEKIFFRLFDVGIVDQVECFYHVSLKICEFFIEQ